MPILVLGRLPARTSARFRMSRYGPMKASLKIAGLLCAPVLLFLAGCDRMAQSWYLSSYEREISSSTQAIETARDDVHRAAAYAKRGSAYSEKARYSRAFKLISADEYARLFGLAVKDHDQADSARSRQRRGLFQPGANLLRPGRPGGRGGRHVGGHVLPTGRPGSTRQSPISRRPSRGTAGSIGRGTCSA